MSGGTRNYATGSDKVYRVVVEYTDNYVAEMNRTYKDKGIDYRVTKQYYAAGPYTTAPPAKRECNKYKKQYMVPAYRNRYEAVYIEEGVITWGIYED